ncbi:MAG TPA: ATP-binding protein [Acidobacteriaceae bacterium]|nr:ATP-binding protein [Acidobacteriaceae bacterium]
MMGTTTAAETGAAPQAETTLYTTERVSLDDYAEQLCSAFAVAGLTPQQLCGLGEADLLRMQPGAVIHDPSKSTRAFWVLLDGEIIADKLEEDGNRMRVYIARRGDSFGEFILLSGRQPSLILTASQPSTGLRIDEATFWNLMACAEPFRKVVLGNMAQRLQSHMAEAAHREKLISLGTLAAGLMHELHNPVGATKRSASQLRDNLMRLQEVSLRNTGRIKTPDQMQCMHELLVHAISQCRMTAMSSLEQADAEEAMSEWLDEANVTNAFTIGPALVAIGFEKQELQCARDVFEADAFSDALNWLEALISSIAQVESIENSVGRVSELVMAVKKFAYDDRCTMREVDVHDSIQSTLTILGHKMRQRQLTVVKHFDAVQPKIRTSGVAVSQVWTNLLDNAIDASPDGGEIVVKTWTENGALAVSIGDHGPGVPQQLKERIFAPFFTTKPVGKGTGLGLEIVKRIVTQSFAGTISVESEPGDTRFIVRLPQ